MTPRLIGSVLTVGSLFASAATHAQIAPASEPPPASELPGAAPEPVAPPPASPAPTPPPASSATQYPYPYPYPYPYYPYPVPYPYAPPHAAPPPQPRVRYPSDSAVRSWPFVDFIVGGASFQQRFTHFLMMGAEVGVYLGNRVRVAPQVSIITSKPDDRVDQELANGFFASPADDPTILWGGSIGVALLSHETFALSPGVMFLRTDVSDYGNFLGVNLPLDWVTSNGVRLGFVLAVGRGFGGTVRGTCPSVSFGPSPNAPNCDPGEIREFNRDSAPAFYSHFHVGWGADHPDPVKTE